MTETERLTYLLKRWTDANQAAIAEYRRHPQSACRRTSCPCRKEKK